MDIDYIAKRLPATAMRKHGYKKAVATEIGFWQHHARYPDVLSLQFGHGGEAVETAR